MKIAGMANAMTLIAVPTRNENVDDHFGHCDHYTIYTVSGNVVKNRTTMESPQGCGCKSDVAEKLQAMGVTVMLAGSMGEGAKNKLNANNINVVRGCSGNVDKLVEAYLAGEVKDNGEGCHSHECSEH